MDEKTILKEKLIRLLNEISAYNDKGYYWCGHTSEQSEAYRQDAVRRMKEIIQNHPNVQIPDDMLTSLFSKETLYDGSMKSRERINSW